MLDLASAIDINLWIVLFAAGLTAVATAVGALPFVFSKDISRWWLDIANGCAVGLMLGASHTLIREGFSFSPAKTLAGIFIGLFLLVIVDKLIGGRDFSLIELDGADARRALLVLGVMTAHSFAEGVGVGVAFGEKDQLGFFITAAVAAHNIPEGMAICLILVPRGMPVWKAAGWSLFTSLAQPIMAVPAFLLVLVFRPFLPIGLGLAAGAMICMVFAELIPDSDRCASGPAVGAAVTLAFTLLLAFQHYVLPM